MCKKGFILPSLLNRQHKAEDGRVGQPNHRLLSFIPHIKLCYDGRKQNVPKPDTKTPINQRVEKNVNKKRVPPTKLRGATLGFSGILCEKCYTQTCNSY